MSDKHHHSNHRGVATRHDDNLCKSHIVSQGYSWFIFVLDFSCYIPSLFVEPTRDNPPMESLHPSSERSPRMIQAMLNTISSSFP